MNPITRVLVEIYRFFIRLLYRFKHKTNPHELFEQIAKKLAQDSMKLPFAEVNDSLKYVVDVETNTIVWADEGLQHNFEEGLVGQKCYEVLQGCLHPCDFCTNHKLIKDDEVYTWVHRNDKLKQTFLIRDFKKTMDGRVFRYEMAIPITNHIKEILRHG